MQRDGEDTAGPAHSGRYQMLRRIAGGGMGEVYLAAASGPAGFRKLAVIKRILPHYADDPDFVAMFVNEARLAASLDHPNIVRVYDFGEAQGSFFYAMEYLHGDSLAALLPRTQALPERLPLAHALTIGLGMCAGLHFAHERCGPDGKPLGVVHRDVSPGNVFVTCEGEVKILDFGIAKAMATTGVTRDGTRKGKVPYMSPEQCIGAPLDRRSDVFAIGIVLYEMTTLSRLFRADNEFATMNMITAGAIPHPATRVPDYPPALAEVVLKALHRDPEQRHASALALHEELEHVGHELGLRTSSLALGRHVRQLIDDRAYPSTSESAPDEVQTRVFFDALNDVLTARDGAGVLPLPPLLPSTSPHARPQASLTTPLPGAAPLEDTLVRRPSARRRSRVAVITGGLLATAVVLALAWPRGSPDPTPAPAQPVVPVATPPAPVTPPPVADPTPPPEIEAAADPPPSPRTRPAGERSPRKKPAPASPKKPNVLDSLRPNK